MPAQLTQDSRMSTDLSQSIYGQYVGTFLSQQKQVRADLFRYEDQIVAHVSFAKGLDASTVTDGWLSALSDVAAANGLPDRLRIVYS